MKNYLLALACCIAAAPIFAQTPIPSTLWTSAIQAVLDGPDNTGPQIFDIAVSPSGDVYIAGMCYDTATFSNNVTVIPGIEEETMFLARINGLTGDVEWVRDLGFMMAFQESIHLSVDPLNGGVYLSTAFSEDEVDFGNGIKAVRTCSGNCMEVLVVKFDDGGQAKWVNTISGGAGAVIQPVGVEANSLGKLFIGGNFDGVSVDFGPNFVYNNLSGSAFFLAEYNITTGKPTAVYFPSAESDPSFLAHIDLNNNNQLILSGYLDGTLKFENGLSALGSSNPGGFIAGLSGDGTATWIHVVGSSDYFDLLSIDMDESGNAYLGIDASVDLYVNKTKVLDINSSYAGIVVKLDSMSNSLPVVIGYNTDDYAMMDAKVDHWGNIYTTGFISEDQVFGSTTVEVDGCVDGLITITNQDGQPVSARTIGGAGCEGLTNGYYAASIGLDQAGFMYATGVYLEGYDEDGYIFPHSGSFTSKFNTSSVGTEEPESTGLLQISPNPTAGNFTLRLTEMPAVETDLIIYDLNGRMVHRQSIETSETNVQVNLQTGTYVATLQNGVRMERQKLVVQAP